jgi:hemoglobin/transferrin/lactoferrin receptor protein
MKKTIAVLACVFSVMGYAQTKKDTLNEIELDQIIVTSQRFAKQKRTISQQVESISKNEIEFQNSQNTADVFANSGMLAIQKSQQGGGSPVIRGFEASRILLVLDGIRMNNLIYRGGHLQNSITVDKNMLENIDVLFGPSSTIYGSDALGGAIFLQTKNAKLFSENGNKSFSGNFLTNYSSVNEGKSGHLDFNFGSEKWASLTSFSYNDYGDLKMGKQKNGSNDFFGERPFYIETINGVDTKVANDDKYVQKFSGYKQYDFMQKIVFQPSTTTRHSLNLQYSTTTDIPRYDRLTDADKNGNLLTATWNYGPQKRLLGAYKLSKQQLFLNTDFNLTLSYQNIEESRLTRDVGKIDLENRIEKVSIFAINSDFKTKIGNGDFIYGVDFVYDDLKSSAFAKNILTGVEAILDTRYHDGKNSTFSGEGFAYFNNKIDAKSSYNASLRAGYKTLKSEIISNSLNLPYTEVNQKKITYSGAIGFVNNPTKNVKVAFNLASAYRVPNIDDLSKTFKIKKDKLLVPNNDLKPEKSVTADLSITFWDGNRFQFENTFFYTKLYDPILTDNFIFNGEATFEYKNVKNTVVANQNQGSGSIFGISSSLKGYLTKSFLFYANLNATKGRIQNNMGNFPLDHIAPVYGKVGFRFENNYLNLDLNMNYNGKKSLTDYSPSGEDNLQYAVATGTPSWETYNFKAGVSAIKHLTIFTGVENILDTQYRTFSSGINAGGRNVYVGAKYSL